VSFCHNGSLIEKLAKATGCILFQTLFILHDFWLTGGMEKKKIKTLREERGTELQTKEMGREVSRFINVFLHTSSTSYVTKKAFNQNEVILILCGTLVSLTMFIC